MEEKNNKNYKAFASTSHVDWSIGFS